MKNKKIIIGVSVAAVAVAGAIVGACACSSQDELHKMIEKGEQIELEVATLDHEEKGTDTEIIWTELAKLTTYANFRTAFENAMGIQTNGGLKTGVVYVDLEGNQTNNSTLYNAFMNNQFISKWNDETVQSQLRDGISTTYADLEESDYTASIINAYFNLIDDNQPNYFNGGASLSRAEAMTILMRAVTPVEELKVNDNFASLVGESEYTDYASYMDSYSFISSSDKSISEKNFNGAMTRAEFIYMVMNYTFGKETVSNYDVSKVSLNDCKDAGDIAATEKFSGKDYCNSYVLTQMINNPADGATTEIYKALAMAKDLGVISAETRWDESISKTEGIEIIANTFQAYTTLNGATTEDETGVLDENITAVETEAKSAYEAIKNDISLSEDMFIENYKDLVMNKGLNKDEAITEIRMLYSNAIEEKTEAPTETQAPNNNEQAVVTPESLEEAYKLTPSGSYTDTAIDPGEDMATMFPNIKVVRRTYENGAIRDIIIIDGEEAVLEAPWGSSDNTSTSSNYTEISVSTEQPTQSTEKKVVYEGIFPPRSDYSSDEEWEAAVTEIIVQYNGEYSYSYFSSAADAELYEQLCKGGFTGDLDFANMSGEEWAEWCEEHGVTVN